MSKMKNIAIHNNMLRTYNLKSGNNTNEIRIEVISDNISFLLKNLSTLDYIYKNNINISSLVNELKLSANCISDKELLLQSFDNIYKNKKILIHFINEDNLSLKIETMLGNLFEIKLKKEMMNINDKINILYNEINLIKNHSQNPNNDNTFKNIIINMNKKEDDIKNKINELDKDKEKKIEEIINEQKIKLENFVNENNKYKMALAEEMNNIIKELKSKIEAKINEFKIECETKIKNLESNFKSKENTINELKQYLNKKYNSFFMKIVLRNRKPINVLLTNNHILNENDIKIGSKIKIKCQHKEKEIEINDYRFTSTNKNLNYTCIQIFNSEFGEDYFKEKNFSIIKLNKNLNDNKFIEFNDLNQIYRDIEYKLSLDYFLNEFGICHRKFYEEIKRLSRIEEEFGLLSLMGIKLLFSHEKTNEIKGFIKAPENSPYRNGIFKFKILLGNYPNDSPTLIIETNIFHCNYHFQIGRLMIDYLMNWNNDKHLLGVLTSLYEFFISNNPESCYNYEAGEMIRNNRSKFEQICQEYVNKYANYENIDEVRYLFEEYCSRKNDDYSDDYINLVYDLRKIRLEKKRILDNIYNLEDLIRNELGLFNDFAALVGNMAFSSLRGLKKEDFSKISNIFIIPKIRCG